MKKIPFILLAVFAICIGLYPITYFLVERTFGLLQFKSVEVLNAPLWNIGFYGHIIPAGVALLIGWVQFSKKWRNTNIQLHRTIGKVYIISVLISGVCSLYISLFATGGIISAFGFASLGIVWLATTILAFMAVKNGDLKQHEQYMIYSYAACFGAVTLRIWLPLLQGAFGDFVTAYKIVAWLSWIPNMVVAYFIIRKSK